MTGATGYYIDVSEKNDFSIFVSGLQNSLLGNVATLGVSGLTPGLTYYYRLRSTNPGGTSPNSTTANHLLMAATPVALDATNTTSTSFKAKWQPATGATEYRVDVSLVADNFNPSLSSYTDVLVAGAATSELLVTSLIANTGYKYRVRSVNGSGTSPNSNSISVSTLAQGSSNATLAIPNLTSGGTLESYRMFSIPMELQNNDSTIATIFNSLGTYAKDKWRLLRWHATGNSWNEYQNGLTTIDRGKSYWFNSVSPPSVIVTGADFSKPSFKLTLEKGWNQIGSPYNFDISWADVLALNGNPTNVETNLYKYVPSPAGFAPTDNLKAWSGNFIFNKSTSSIILTIPSTVKRATGGRVFESKPNSELSGPDWFVPMTLYVAGAENSTVGFGMHPDADVGIDQFDGITMPRFISYLELNSYHPEFFEPYFAKDVVPAQKNFNWHFTAESNFENKSATLTWDNTAFGSNNAQLMLYDPASGFIVDMKQTNRYSFHLDKKRPLHFFFASDKESFQPDITSLASAYPNPVTTTVTFPFFTAGDNLVQIEVYDMMGKKVKSVVNAKYEAGLQQVQWDGNDEQGSRVAAGLYIYRFIGGSSLIQTGKLIIK